METIFDFNPTEEEMKRSPWAADKETADFVFAIPDNCFYTLGLLFAMRGNMEKAKTYFAKIDDRAMLSSLMQDLP